MSPSGRSSSKIYLWPDPAPHAPRHGNAATGNGNAARRVCDLATVRHRHERPGLALSPIATQDLASRARPGYCHRTERKRNRQAIPDDEARRRSFFASGPDGRTPRCNASQAPDQGATVPAKQGEGQSEETTRPSIHRAILRSQHRQGDRATPHQQGANRRAKHIPHWAPNQLRHLRSLEVKRKFGLDTARAVLGHKQPCVTEMYAGIDTETAAEAMGKIGEPWIQWTHRAAG